MSVRRSSLASPKLVKFIAALVVGLSVGTMVKLEPVALPVLGSVPGLAVGGVGLLVGAVLYVRGPKLLGASGCGCGADCGCS